MTLANATSQTSRYIIEAEGRLVSRMNGQEDTQIANLSPLSEVENDSGVDTVPAKSLSGSSQIPNHLVLSFRAARQLPISVVTAFMSWGYSYQR